jgi:hypothetical protein
LTSGKIISNIALFTCIVKTIQYDTKKYRKEEEMSAKYPTKVKSPSGIVIAVLIAAYLIFASTTPVQGTQWFYQTNLLPPENGMYNCTSSLFANYASGIVIKNWNARAFTAGVVPPLPGSPVTHNFGSQVEFEISFNGGTTYTSITANAANTMRIAYQSSSGGEDTYQTEMMQMDVSGGGLPAGVMIRESTTKTSIGQMGIKPIPGGYMISSFFDIYTEVSTDGGGSWQPTISPGTIGLKVDPAFYSPVAAPRTVLPMPNGEYTSPSGAGQAYASGIVIKNIRQKLFTVWAEPPTLGLTNTHTYNLQIDFDFSTDGGLSFSHCHSPATVTETIKHTRDFQSRATYETEMTQMDISGGDLPAGVMIRESPTKVSQGGVSMLAGGGGGGAGGGAAISSFFDIFTEVSTDGGATWQPASNRPEHLELERVAPVYTYANNLWPPLNGEYLDKGGWFAYFASGIVISNVHQHAFTMAISPPLPGITTSFTFVEQVNLEISYDGGLTFTPATAPAIIDVQITARLGDDGTTEYYDTEMTQLSLSGGTLPMGIQIRESPTHASLGRTTSSAAGGGATYQIDSFFDIYTEVSIDSGMSWQPSLLGPATIYMRPRPCQKCSDLNGNGITDMLDLKVFVANWLWAESVGQTDNTADLNCDEKVNFEDYAILAENWLQACHEDSAHEDLMPPTIPGDLVTSAVRYQYEGLYWDHIQISVANVQDDVSTPADMTINFVCLTFTYASNGTSGWVPMQGTGTIYHLGGLGWGYLIYTGTTLDYYGYVSMAPPTLGRQWQIRIKDAAGNIASSDTITITP